jgi:hypothetical protein
VIDITLFSKIFPENNDVHQGAISYANSQSSSNEEDKNAIVFYPFAANTIITLRQDQQIIQYQPTPRCA